MDGNLSKVASGGPTVTMSYDKENRLINHLEGSAITTYTYDGDGLKRSERTGVAITTLVWNGSEYLQERA